MRDFYVPACRYYRGNYFHTTCRDGGVRGRISVVHTFICAVLHAPLRVLEEMYAVGGVVSLLTLITVLTALYYTYDGTSATGIVSVRLARRSCTFNISGARPRLSRGISTFVSGVVGSNAFSSVYGGCFNSNVPIGIASTRGSDDGSRLIITAGTTFRPFRCGSKDDCINVSVRVTTVLTGRLNGRLIVSGVSFSTIYLSINRRGTSVTVTNLAIGRSEGRRIGFSGACCGTSRGVVIGSNSAAFSSYGATSSILTGLRTVNSSIGINCRGNAANTVCIRGRNSCTSGGLGIGNMNCGGNSLTIRSLLGNGVGCIIVSSTPTSYVIGTLGTGTWSTRGACCPGGASPPYNRTLLYVPWRNQARCLVI